MSARRAAGRVADAGGPVMRWWQRQRRQTTTAISRVRSENCPLSDVSINRRHRSASNIGSSAANRCGVELESENTAETMSSTPRSTI